MYPALNSVIPDLLDFKRNRESKEMGGSKVENTKPDSASASRHKTPNRSADVPEKNPENVSCCPDITVCVDVSCVH